MAYYHWQSLYQAAEVSQEMIGPVQEIVNTLAVSKLIISLVSFGSRQCFVVQMEEWELLTKKA